MIYGTRGTGNLMGVVTRRSVYQDIGDKAPLMLRIARANIRASGMAWVVYARSMVLRRNLIAGIKSCSPAPILKRNPKWKQQKTK